MAGRADMAVRSWRGAMPRVSAPVAISMREKIDPAGGLWSTVLASTGQPKTT